MNEIREKAKQDYLNGMKYKDIATKYDVSINTVKSWVSRYGWAKLKKGAHKNKKGAYEKEGVYTDKNHEKEVAEKIVKNVTKNEELTDKQQLFCIYYLKYFNATKAYQKAYGCDYLTANANGPRLLVNASIKQQIEKLKSERMEGIYLDGKDILQKYIDIAFADITDYVSFGQEEVVVDIDDEGEPIKRKINVVKLKDSDEIDGTIINEVSKGKDGVKIKLADKMKALEFLANNIGLLSVQDQARVELEKTKIRKLVTDIERIEGDEDALEKLDKLIEAIDNEAKR